MTKWRQSDADQGELMATRHNQPERQVIMSNCDALIRFVTHVYPDGVPATDAPIVQAAAMLAQAVDQNPTTASLWAQYRGALGDLMEVTGNDGDEIEWLAEQLRTAAGDPED